MNEANRAMRVQVILEEKRTVVKTRRTTVTLMIPAYAGSDSIENLARDYVNGPGRDGATKIDWIDDEFHESLDIELIDSNPV